jgi:hypothetical protein
MDYFLRKSLSKYLTDMIDFNKHVHDIDVFINDKSRTSLLTANFQTKHVKLNFDKTFGIVAV